jgi:hypothetical protein
MPERTVQQAFDQLLADSVPTSGERSAAARHRESVEDVLERLNIFGLWETGSFHHGTAVRGHADVDVLVSLKGARPQNSDTALDRVKSALAARFQFTPIRVSRPAVVVNFASGRERWEVIPAYYSRTQNGFSVYDIPAPGGNWMETSPSAHLQFVTEVNKAPAGGAKGLARLMKVWKYTNPSSVKVSSFYLEMRAAKRMANELTFIPKLDFLYLMTDLSRGELAAMNDPSGLTGRIRPTSTEGYRVSSLATLSSDAQRVEDAIALERHGKRAEAFRKLDMVFPGAFPSRSY